MSPLKSDKPLPPKFILDLRQDTDSIKLKLHTGMYVLHQFRTGALESVFFVQILEGKHQGKGAWLRYNEMSPLSILLTNQSWDKIAYPTEDPALARYILAGGSQAVRIDEEYKKGFFKWAQSNRIEWDKHQFTKLEDILPITNSEIEDVATDSHLACPNQPQRKNGEKCPMPHPVPPLSPTLKSLILASANKYEVSPELVASIIEAETQFNFFQENESERAICLKPDTPCSPYRWGKGLAQLGASEAKNYNINWFAKALRPKECRKNYRSESCVRELVKICNDSNRLTPYFCPQKSIDAVAKKLSRTLPIHQIIWTADGQGYKPLKISGSFLNNSNFQTRITASAYNRGGRVINSLSEHYRQKNKWPKSFGELWSTPRLNSTPRREVSGYSMLTKEYINRCYVWKIGGICGQPGQLTFIQQYRKQFTANLTDAD